jgi:hypothetical protein
MRVEKKIRIFRSFEKAYEADIREHAAMTPEERIQIVIELRDRHHPDAAEQGLAPSLSDCSTRTQLNI